MLDVVTPPTLARRGPLESAASRFPHLQILPSLDRVLLQTSAPDLPALAPLSLPRSVGGVTEQDGRAALCLGPDEWLLLSPPGDALAAQLCRADGAWSAVDVRHRQAALCVSGPQAALLLNAFCPLDLHPSVFRTGACTRTVFAKAEIVLWRRAATAFHVEVTRSFARYLWDLLQEAALGMPTERV